jgi:hypothetical protein
MLTNLEWNKYLHDSFDWPATDSWLVAESLSMSDVARDWKHA